MRLLIGMIFACTLVGTAIGQDFQRDETVHWIKWTKARENVSYGYGPLIDDLESYVIDDKYAKQMRNRSDPGNWVHETTHLVNATFRNQIKKRTGIQFNSFYVFDGYAFSAPEPKVTLLQVADAVPKADRGDNYQHYLRKASSSRNNQPLFVLDEATAYCNCVLYQISVKKPDRTRCNAMNEFLAYADALIVAIETHDPKYAKLDRVKAYITWNKKRAEHLTKLHRSLVRYKLW